MLKKKTEVTTNLYLAAAMIDTKLKRSFTWWMRDLRF